MFANLLPIAVWVFAGATIALVAGGAACDAILEWRDLKPLGSRIRDFAHFYPGFIAILALIAGMLVAHFFFSIP